MQNVTWQRESTDPNNVNHFAEISQWWTSLGGQEITWQQRLIPEAGAASDLDWQPQRFDETFLLTQPQVRGITLYWQKPDAQQERNTTPQTLELDRLQQALYIYPQSQSGLVIRVALPQVVYQQVKIAQPELLVARAGEQAVLVVRDEEQRLEIQVSLNPEKLAELRQKLA